MNEKPTHANEAAPPAANPVEIPDAELDQIAGGSSNLNLSKSNAPSATNLNSSKSNTP